MALAQDVCWPKHKKGGVLRKPCGSGRWSRHRKGGLGTGRVVCHGVPRKLCGSVKVA